MLCCPILSIPSHTSMKSHTGRFLKTCFCLSLIVAVTQITFHIVLLALPPYGYFLKNCKYVNRKIKKHQDLNDFLRIFFQYYNKINAILLGEILETSFRHLGLVRLDDASVFEIFFWLAPEIIVPPTTLLIFYICRRLNFKPGRDDESFPIPRLERKIEDRNEKVSLLHHL